MSRVFKLDLGHLTPILHDKLQHGASMTVKISSCHHIYLEQNVHEFRGRIRCCRLRDSGVRIYHCPPREPASWCWLRLLLSSYLPSDALILMRMISRSMVFYWKLFSAFNTWVQVRKCVAKAESNLSSLDFVYNHRAGS